jgi:ribosomal protein L16/L10AE
MKQFPNNIIYKKSHKIQNFKGNKAVNLALFTSGLKLKKDSCYLSYAQFEASRRVIVRLLRPKEIKNKKNLKLIHSARKRKVKSRSKTIKKRFLFLRTNFCLPLTKKPLQVRMGKGKGNPYTWVYAARRSRVIFEMSRQRYNLRLIHKLFHYSALKLPRKVKFIFDKRFTRRETNFSVKPRTFRYFKGY